ncbi:hypothetical protein Hdeb2414_s0086g00785461 [Helianthus debilis subsp. tardiflorus]
MDWAPQTFLLSVESIDGEVGLWVGGIMGNAVIRSSHKAGVVIWPFWLPFIPFLFVLLLCSFWNGCVLLIPWCIIILGIKSAFFAGRLGWLRLGVSLNKGDIRKDQVLVYRYNFLSLSLFFLLSSLQGLENIRLGQKPLCVVYFRSSWIRGVGYNWESGGIRALKTKRVVISLYALYHRSACIFHSGLFFLFLGNLSLILWFVASLSGISTIRATSAFLILGIGCCVQGSCISQGVIRLELVTMSMGMLGFWGWVPMIGKWYQESLLVWIGERKLVRRKLWSKSRIFEDQENTKEFKIAQKRGCNMNFRVLVFGCDAIRCSLYDQNLGIDCVDSIIEWQGYYGNIKKLLNWGVWDLHSYNNKAVMQSMKRSKGNSNCYFWPMMFLFKGVFWEYWTCENMRDIRRRRWARMMCIIKRLQGSCTLIKQYYGKKRDQQNMTVCCVKGWTKILWYKINIGAYPKSGCWIDKPVGSKYIQVDKGCMFREWYKIVVEEMWIVFEFIVMTLYISYMKWLLKSTDWEPSVKDWTTETDGYVVQFYEEKRLRIDGQLNMGIDVLIKVFLKLIVSLDADLKWFLNGFIIVWLELKWWWAVCDYGIDRVATMNIWALRLYGWSNSVRWREYLGVMGNWAESKWTNYKYAKIAEMGIWAWWFCGRSSRLRWRQSLGATIWGAEGNWAISNLEIDGTNKLGDVSYWIVWAIWRPNCEQGITVWGGDLEGVYVKWTQGVKVNCGRIWVQIWAKTWALLKWNEGWYNENMGNRCTKRKRIVQSLDRILCGPMLWSKFDCVVYVMGLSWPLGFRYGIRCYSLYRIARFLVWVMLDLGPISRV